MRIYSALLLLLGGIFAVPLGAASGVYASNSHTLFYLPLDGPNAGAPEGCAILNPALLSYIPDRFNEGASAIHVNGTASASDFFAIACSNTKIAGNGAGNFTVGYWIRSSLSIPAGGNCSLETGVCSSRNLTILASNTGNGGCGKYADIEVRFGKSPGAYPLACTAGGPVPATSSTSIADGVWHNLIWVFDYTNQVVTFYLDGIPNTTGSLPNPSPLASNSQYIAGAENGSFALNGDMDDLWIEDHAWSAAKVAAYFSGVGTIQVTSNLGAATFSVTGPQNFSGNGTTASFVNAQPGTYTVTFGAVAGYVTPAAQTETLASGSTITFTGTYNTVTSPSALLSSYNLDFGFGIVQRGPSGQPTLWTDVEIPASTASLVITNAGSAALTFPTNAFTFNSSDFMLGTGASACTTSNPVAPGSTCTVYITFNPQASAPRATVLTVRSNDPAGSQAVNLTGIGMNVFYQFGATFVPPDPDVQTCFDIVSASLNLQYKSEAGCAMPPPWANSSMGYETQGYGCFLMSVASVLSTFNSYATITPAILDPSDSRNLTSNIGDPENGLYVLPGSGNLRAQNVPGNFLVETCDVNGNVLTGGCGSASRETTTTLDQYLGQHVVDNGDRVILKLSETSACGAVSAQHYVTVVAQNAAQNDWVLFDPGWPTANARPNYLLSVHENGFVTGYGTKKFVVCGAITFVANPSTSSLAISAYSPLEFLVTDSQGHRVGNIQTGEDVSEIPQSSYSRDFPIANDDGAGPPLGDPTGVKTAYIVGPAAGSYQLQITGNALGTFTLISSATASDGSVQTTSFNGITNIGAIAQYQFQYSPVPGIATQLSLAPSSQGSVPPNQISTTASGLAYSRVSQTFNGSITIKNISDFAINGPLEVVLTSLTVGVTLANGTNSIGGNPYLVVPGLASLAPGQTATLNVQFKNPSNGIINFTPVVYSGSLN